MSTTVNQIGLTPMSYLSMKWVTMLSHSGFDRGYVDLQKKIVRQLKSAKIQHQMFETLEMSFDAVLAEDGIIVSRVERKRLLARVTQDVLGDMLKRLENSSTAKK